MTKETMKNRVLRVPDHVWQAAKQRAETQNETVSDAIRRFLASYGAKPQRLSLIVAAAPVKNRIDAATSEALREKAMLSAARDGRLARGRLRYDGPTPYKDDDGVAYHQWSIETIEAIL